MRFAACIPLSSSTCSRSRSRAADLAGEPYIFSEGELVAKLKKASLSYFAQVKRERDEYAK